MILLLTLMMIFQICICQWIEIKKFYCENLKFQNLTNVGGFSIPLLPKSAYFIDCNTPGTSYVTLSKEDNRLISDNEIEFNSGDYISVDLFFQDTWQNGNIQIKFGNEVFTQQYSSPNQLPISNGFCDIIQTDVQTLVYTLQSTQKIQVEFQISNPNNNGQVSIKNFYISRLLCYPLCKSCTGPEHNQCTSCYSGSPNNNRCPLCPDNQLLMPNIGCSLNCHFYYREIQEKICVYFKSSTLYFEQLYPNEKRYTTMIPNFIGYSEYNQASISQLHGIFTKTSGTYRFIDLSSFHQGYYLIGLRIVFSLYDLIPIGGRIEVQINNTYYGSIYQTDQGTQFHRIQKNITEQVDCVGFWTNCQTQSIFMFVDIPKYSFVLKIVGNYKNSNSAWSIKEIEVSSGQCQHNCKYCEIPYVCSICDDGLYVSSDGNCVKCEEYYQSKDQNSCIDYDQETSYSRFLIKNEQFSQINSPSQSSQYVVVSQEAVNFLKGSNILYSIWLGKYIFGGQYVWSQAKFKITHQIQNPHHGVTIRFYILYGPNFPQDSQFIYTFDNDEPIIKSRTSATLSFEDSTVSERVRFIHTHSTNTLTLYWECQGVDNNPEDAYCGVYGYNVVVHYCQPYCLECVNEITCTKWDNSVDVNLHTEKGCQAKTYYNKQEQQCLSCPQTCLICTSEIHCQSCVSTFTLTKSGCSCLMDQYYANNQCYDCPIGCNQCVNDQICVECLTANNRELLNGKCECLAGYYSIDFDPVCKKCNSQSICNCSLGTSYDVSSNSCKTCHSSCQTCFRLSIDGCLTCNINNKRILKGLKCVCMPGYYESNGSCLSCPTIENQSDVQCYKFCNQDMSVWHTQTCKICDLGFKLVYGECMPICGDFLVVGYEQCEDGNNDIDDLCFNCQYQCPRDCSTCNSSTQLPCTGYCGDMIVNGRNEECDDGNQIQFDGCHNCKFQCSSKCTKCIKGKCVQCVTKKQQISFTMSPENCLQQCGFSYVIESDQCINDNSSTVDQCQICRFNCRSNCSNCDHTTGTCLGCDLPGFKPYSSFCKNICGDKIIVQDPTNFSTEYCDDGNIINRDLCSSQCRGDCQEEEICTNCINNRCYACGIGYYLSKNYSCYAICGDGIKAKEEPCDRDLPYNGCNNCKARCQNSCQNCDTQGTGCLECQEGYQNIDNMCYTICGDGFVTADEQCDDGNLIFEDRCHQCLKTCTIGCSDCNQGVCYDCHEGFQYFKYQCIKINDKYHDPRCDSNCLDCSIEGHGCLQCKGGYQNIDNRCYSICGDNIQVDPEQCDDSNYDFEDPCHQCLFNCPFPCSNCFEGICYQCKEGYFIYKNICYSKIENNSLAQLTNFLYSNYYCQQSFSQLLFLSNKIQVQILGLDKQKVFNQIGTYPELIKDTTNSINLQVDLQCSQNQKLNIQLNNFQYVNGFDTQSVIFQHQCHNTINHAISLSFQLNKLNVKDEILVIIITENEFKLSLIVLKFLQTLFSFKFVDL